MHCLKFAFVVHWIRIITASSHLLFYALLGHCFENTPAKKEIFMHANWPIMTPQKYRISRTRTRTPILFPARQIKTLFSPVIQIQDEEKKRARKRGGKVRVFSHSNPRAICQESQSDSRFAKSQSYVGGKTPQHCRSIDGSNFFFRGANLIMDKNATFRSCCREVRSQGNFEICHYLSRPQSNVFRFCVCKKNLATT